MKRLAESPELRVKVYSMTNSLYQGNAYALSAVNKVGPIDILPGHANLISILDHCVLSIDSAKGTKDLQIQKGLLIVSSNEIVIFVDI